MNRVLAIVSVMALLVGCVPMKFDYYKPVGPGGYFKSQCGGPDDFLGFEVSDGLGVMVSTRALGAGLREGIAVSFHLGEAHTLKFSSSEFVLVSNVPNKTTTYTATGVDNLQYVKQPDGRWISEMKSFPITAELQGALRPSEFRSAFYKAFQNYQSFSLEIPVGEQKQHDFEIRFPRVLLDGREVAIPDIKVEYRTDIHLSFIC